MRPPIPPIIDQTQAGSVDAQTAIAPCHSLGLADEVDLRKHVGGAPRRDSTSPAYPSPAPISLGKTTAHELPLLGVPDEVAVGGEFLKGHSIEVGCLECGDITVDGIPVLGTLPSTYHLEDLAVIDYSDQGLLVDEVGGGRSFHRSEARGHVVGIDVGPLGAKQRQELARRFVQGCPRRRERQLPDGAMRLRHRSH